MNDMKYKIVCHTPTNLQEILDSLPNEYVIVEINVEPVVLESVVSRDIILSGYICYIDREENDK